MTSEYLKPADMNPEPRVEYVIEGKMSHVLRVATNGVGFKSAEIEWLKDGAPFDKKTFENQYNDEFFEEIITHRLGKVKKINQS